MTTKLTISLLTTAVLGILSVGCGGLVPIDNGTPDAPGPRPDGQIGGTAKQLFADTVFSALTAKCAACHGASQAPTFMVTGANATYDNVVASQRLVGSFEPATAGLLTIVDNGHYGITYAAADLAKIVAWLDKEREERAIVDPPMDGGVALSPWDELSGCMTLADFVDAGFADAWGNMGAQNNQTCKTCHVNGSDGFMATPVSQPLFDAITQHTRYMALYFVPAGMPPVMTVNTASMTGVSQGLVPHQQHPRFDPAPGFVASQAVLDAANQRKAAGTCGPSRIVD